MFNKRRVFPISAPPASKPVSTNAWNPTIFTVKGRRSSAAKAVRFVSKSTAEKKNTAAIVYIMYPVSYNAMINEYAEAEPYISAVGSGNTPITPSTGIIQINTRIYLQIEFKMFIIYKFIFNSVYNTTYRTVHRTHLDNH